MGDIHQPLHTCSYFSEDYPKGNKGGNLHKLTRKQGVSNLHALWDSVIYRHTNAFLPKEARKCGKVFRARVPLEAGPCTSFINEEAVRLMEKYASEPTVEDLSPMTWAMESAYICKSFFLSEELALSDKG